MRLVFASAVLFQLTFLSPPSATTSTISAVAFSGNKINAGFRPSFIQSRRRQRSDYPNFFAEYRSASSATSTSLFAKKKKKAAPKFDLSFLDEEEAEPLSKKDEMKLAKENAKKAKKKQNEEKKLESVNNEEKKKKNKALEQLEQLERDMAKAASNDSDGPKLSKKELKALKKKEEKEALKKKKKSLKKKERADSEVEVEAEVKQETESEQETLPPVNTKPAKLTNEERIRKERPPPQIKIIQTAQPDFLSLRLEDIYVTFRDQDVLRKCTWGVSTGERVGLVGPNGCGKSTQVKILAGELEPTSGDILKSKQDLRVAVLRQEFIEDLVDERTLKDEFESVFVEEKKILSELSKAEMELEQCDASTDPSKMQEILDKMQSLQSKAEDKEVFSLTARSQKIMDLMGFTQEEMEDLVGSFSGGWKMRIGLGKVLLKEPNILLLDEPTNHLDLESVEWLESFLKNQNSLPMVVVSHDREFLDKVCNKMVDVEGGEAKDYVGNYSRFLQLKKERMDAWHSQYNAQEKKIKEEKAWIQKFKIKQPQATKQRQAKLDKIMQSDSYIQKPPFLGKPFKFRFPPAARLSPEVIEIRNLSHSYAEGANALFDQASLTIEKNDRIAVIGPNGSGKSTLLRLITGQETPDQGTAAIVGQNVVPAYFEQNQADALDLDLTVTETVQKASTDQSYNELRALLGQFLFKGDSVEKKVHQLSGGEKARLSLACMMLSKANLLILDEPTNHLDIASKEMLEEALQHFSGSVIIVSHDRYFVSKVANTIVAIEDKQLVKYGGDYKFYMGKQMDIKEKIEARYVKGLARIEEAPKIDLSALEGDGGRGKKKSFGGAKTANLVTRKDKGVKNAKRTKVPS